MGQTTSKPPLPPPPGGAAAAAASGGGGGGRGGGGDDELTLRYEDVLWDRDKRGDKVVIGRGAFGTVYSGRLRGEPVAIKSEVLRAGEEEAWMNAARLHIRATSPHIVAVRGTIVDRDADTAIHYIVMERLAGTMAAQLLTPGSVHHGADMALRLRLLADVASGLAYLHSYHTIHGDVKPDNVLLTASTPPIAKLADFGSCVLRRDGTKTRETLTGERGTLMYMDPRLYDLAAGINTASDVYSFGVMAWQVLSGLTPFEAEMAGLPPTASGLQIVEALRRHVVGGGRPPVAVLVDRGVPAVVVELVEACWAPVQGERPAMAVAQSVLRAAAMEAAPLVYEWNDQLLLHGHSGSVHSLAQLPGGRLASGSVDDTVRLWGVGCGSETAVLKGHAGEVHALAALPDGCRVAAGVSNVAGSVGTILVWDAGIMPPKWCATIECGSGVLALAVLRDGRLAAGCSDGGVRLVEVVGERAGAVTLVTATLEGLTGGVHALAVLPDGTLASASWDKMVQIWDVGAAVCVATLAGHSDWVRALAVLADGRLASGSDDNSVRLWDVVTRTCVCVLEGHTDKVWTLTALPDGWLVSGSFDCTIRVWDTCPAAVAGGACATPVVVLEGHTNNVLALAPLPGGRFASGSEDGTVRLWPACGVCPHVGAGSTTLTSLIHSF